MIPGPGMESHIRLPAGSLHLPLPVSLPLSVSLMSKSIKSFFKKKAQCEKDYQKDTKYYEIRIRESGRLLRGMKSGIEKHRGPAAEEGWKKARPGALPCSLV